MDKNLVQLKFGWNSGSGSRSTDYKFPLDSAEERVAPRRFVCIIII